MLYSADLASFLFEFLIRAEILLSRHKGVPGFPCRAILGVLEETLGFHKKNTRIEGFELLAEVGKACYELWTEKAGKISNHLCLENNSWTGAQLWNWVARVWGKKGATLWSKKTQRKIISANLEETKFSSCWPKTVELPSKECAEF